jgi:type I restriction enzyme S subunit
VHSKEFQLAIRNLVLSADDFSSAAREEYLYVERYFLSYLNLQNYQPRKQLNFVANYAETKEGKRIDADFFRPEYEELLMHIKQSSIRLQSFAEAVSLRNRNHQPQDEEYFRYIELSNVGTQGEITGHTKEQGKNLPSRARRLVRKGDVIISSIEGSLSSVALITEKDDGALCSTGFHVAYSQEYNPETLFVLMRGIVGQTQLKRGCKGTILTAIGEDELNRIKLPEIEHGIQIEIKARIQQIYAEREKSKHLLDGAKRAVEIAIEKDETAAVDFINREVD